MIFGTSIPKATGHQMAIQFPTSPNICFYTTWGTQNNRNMHWNEQQTSTNWRLDRIKNLITVLWANEVHHLLTYNSTSCYQTCRWWHVHVSAGQCTSASVRKKIELLERKTPDFISPDLWPPTALTSIWSITSSGGSCNSGSIRRRSRMWINSRSDWLKSLVEAEHYWYCYQSMEKPSACLCSRKGPTYRTLTVAVEQRDIWIKCQLEWLKCKPNVIYACYFNKVIILPCIKCNISLVLFSQVV